jgi:hypothetical protein
MAQVAKYELVLGSNVLFTQRTIILDGLHKHCMNTSVPVLWEIAITVYNFQNSYDNI